MKKQFLFLFFLMILGQQLGYAKIYDCFLFFNELDVLEIRLNELYDHVDKFVLVESVQTFRATEKPCYYQDNKKRFEKFADKIIHVIIYDWRHSGAWDVEAYQRNQIMRGLVNCQPDDIILVSDVDEIVRADKIQEIVSSLYHQKNTYVRCEQPLYRFYLNARDYVSHWTGTTATLYANMINISPEYLRVYRQGYPMISNAGWHFTSMGGLKSFVQKLESFSHGEQDLAESKSQDYIYAYMRHHCGIVPIDDNFPKFVSENIPYFLEKGLLHTPLVTREVRAASVL